MAAGVGSRLGQSYPKALTCLTDNKSILAHQIEGLNQLVLDYAVPQVLGEVESYVKYKHDVSTLAVPMQRPAHMSTAGSNTLELKPFF